MRRLLKWSTWRRGGNNAAETSMIVAVAALAVPLLLFVGASWIAYGDNQREADERMTRTLDLLYNNVRATFDSNQLVIANVIGQLDDYASEADIRSNAEKIHERMNRLVESLPQVENVWVLDAAGNALVSAKIYPLPAGLNFADRAYFRTLRDGSSTRTISQVLRGRLKDIDYFDVAQRWRSPDGHFDGVIAVSIRLSYFVDQFKRASDSPLSTASLVRDDGTFLARYPDPPLIRQLGPDSGFMQEIQRHPEQGRYTTQSSGSDSVARFFVYRRLPDLPLYVLHGYALETIRATWIGRMGLHLIFGVPATLALFFLALLASRRAVQQSQTLDQLHEEQARRQLAEESLRQSQKMNAVGQLTAGIAHDFNNLLTGIGGALEMIGRRLPDPAPEIARFLELARSGVMRAATLTQRLLAFSRQQPLQIEAIDANRVVSGMSELLRRTLGEKISIETILAGGLWRAKADAAQLEAAILNLAINGRDAMPDGGTLTIETANAHLDDGYAAANVEVSPGQYVLIAVSDTGSGMDGDTITRAFEPFFTTKQRGQGTGLGLSMTFGYIKQVGGHLKIYSEIGHGTTVKLYLPRAMAEMQAAIEPVAQPATAVGGGPVVLVVEDDPAVRDFAVAACREVGCTVYQAANGEEALAVLAVRQEIDLLFTDIGLPGEMNGRQMAEHAIERRPTLKVLYTTGYTANAIVHHGVLDAGVNFIGKPFSVAALAAKIRSMGF
ncbi:Signal transduction histidine kinase [Enhydrobacter aerosaccus]|uniref:histidine kinase n=1 Tax=Enhydrobacter aerosaccus TaxID=225324 RepID=A0A1T4K170_9HYPH|nr:ATP-binding protein [Enhydrobacter aerosaccus]SJZ36109.1 Signal transduction histidine kinase [Enhydrobacter aerosaccus]